MPEVNLQCLQVCRSQLVGGRPDYRLRSALFGQPFGHDGGFLEKSERLSNWVLASEVLEKVSKSSHILIDCPVPQDIDVENFNIC